jgi:hypothetical protein
LSAALSDLADDLTGLAPPEHPLAVEHRGQLIYLLREAAELEHGIMCQYLFAAFSLKQSTDEGLTPEQLEAVTRWRKVVGEVARQEMLHLALVQNLLTSIGAAPHLGRPNLPSPTPYFPPGVSLALAPFGERALRHFLFLERPEGMPLEDAEGFSAVADQARPARNADDDAIVAHAQDFATVGHLYRAIDIGFAWLTAKRGAARLFIGPPQAQATPESFRWPELTPVTDLASAHKAIDTIVEQGEGVRGAWRTAHFGRFLGILEEYLALKRSDPGFEPARPACAGVVRPVPGSDAPLIDDPLTARVADLFDVVNEIVLQLLARYFAAADETLEQRRVLGDAAVGLMFAGIRTVGQRLTAMPFGPARPGCTAGPTFSLVDQAATVLPHRQAAWVVIEERLREAAEFGRRLAEDDPGSGLGRVCDALERYASTLAAG